MTLDEFAKAMENEDELLIRFWDANMNMMRNVEDDNRHRFIENHGNLEVTRIIAGSFRVVVQIHNPFN